MEEGAAFRSYWSTVNCGIRFSGQISDASKEVYLFIAPYDYVTKVRGNSTGAIDYITAFNSAGKTYQTIIPQKEVDGNVVRLYGGLKSIQTNNLSRKFFGIFYYYENGAYHYAEMPNGEIGQARSMAYLSTSYQEDATSDNDKKMVSYFIEKSIKSAVKLRLKPLV